MAACPNCGDPKAARFCPTCGQEQLDGLPTVRQWLRGATEELLDVEGGLVGSLKQLVRQPGYLTEVWLSGGRVRYVRPFRLYLFAAAVYVLSAEVLGDTPESYAFLTRWFVLVALVPVLVLVIRFTLPFRRASKSLIPHIVFSLHWHTFLLLFVAVVTVPITGALQLLLDRETDWMAFGSLLVPAGYFGMAARRWLGLSWGAAVGRTLMTGLLYLGLGASLFLGVVSLLLLFGLERW